MPLSLVSMLPHVKLSDISVTHRIKHGKSMEEELSKEFSRFELGEYFEGQSEKLRFLERRSQYCPWVHKQIEPCVGETYLLRMVQAAFTY